MYEYYTDDELRDALKRQKQRYNALRRLVVNERQQPEIIIPVRGVLEKIEEECRSRNLDIPF